MANKGGFCQNPPSQNQVSILASFIHHGCITEVKNMCLRDINLSEVAHASSLAHVNGTNCGKIVNVTGNVAPSSPR